MNAENDEKSLQGLITLAQKYGAPLHYAEHMEHNSGETKPPVDFGMLQCQLYERLLNRIEVAVKNGDPKARWIAIATLFVSTLALIVAACQLFC